MRLIDANVSVQKPQVAYKNEVQYATLRRKNENGKKNLENLSMYNAIARPLQKVGYCGAAATVTIFRIGLRFFGSNS